MLYRGSLVSLHDNSGALNLKILNIKKKSFSGAYAKISDIIVGVIKDYDIYKKKIKLKKKDRTTAIIVCTKKKYSKNNLIYIKFSENVCIPLKITRFIVPVASYIYSPIFYEMRYLKRFKVVFKIAGIAY